MKCQFIDYYISLKQFQAKINQTSKHYINIALTVTPSANHFGSDIILPKSRQRPFDKNKNPLTLLAEFNLSTIPSKYLTSINFPVDGILQFYISEFSELYGMDYKHLNTSDGFKVIYLVDKDKPTSNQSSNLGNLMKNRAQITNPFFITNKSYPVDFELKSMTITPTDYQFEQVLPELSASDNQEAYSQYNDTTVKSGIRFGGYPYFIQQDPRLDQKFKDYILLFQVDSVDGIWSWGSMGVATFLIDPADLISLDFSKVLFYWDCE